MTEAEWLACDQPERLLALLRDQAARRGRLSCGCCRVRCHQRAAFCPAYRKLRLYACACCRRVLRLLSDPVCRGAVEALERYIEGPADDASCAYATEVFDRTRRARFPKYA